MANTSYATASNLLDKLRTLNENAKNTNKTVKVLKEEAISSNNNAIAITDDPKFGDKVLSNQINQFHTSVDSSTRFGEANPDNPGDSPLIYMPDSGNIVFSGVIPTLNNLKWQFVLNDNCFIWSEGLILNKENLVILNKLQGFYKNWCEQWRQSAKELQQLKNVNS